MAPRSRPPPFYQLEDAETPLHVGALAFFGGAGAPDGVDRGAVRSVIATQLELLPRYRMRMLETPLTRHPLFHREGRQLRGFEVGSSRQIPGST